MSNRLSKTMRMVGRTMLTSYPLLGLCKTPTILWIRSMATLCWKLLKPVNQKHNTPIIIYTLRSHSQRKSMSKFTVTLSHTNMHTHTTSTHDISKILWADESATRLSLHTRCTLDHINGLRQYRLLHQGKHSIAMDSGQSDHVNLCSASTHLAPSLHICLSGGSDAYRGQICLSSVHSAAPAGAWQNLVAQRTDRERGGEDR